MSAYTSKIIRPIGDAIATIAADLDLGFEFRGYGVDPNVGTMQPPCAVVGLPDLDRPDALEARPQIGSNDWNLTFPIEISFDLDELPLRADQMADAVEAFTVAIDNDGGLGIEPSTDFTIQTSRVVSVRRPFADLDLARPQMICQVEIQVVAYVP